MSYSVTLSWTATIDDPSTAVNGCYLSVTATGVTGFNDAGVFVFQRQVYEPATGAKASYLTNVASPVDMADLPLGEPSPSDTTTVLWRQSNFQAYFLNRAILDAALSAIQSDVQELCTAANRQTTYLAGPYTSTYTGS